ncbi:hypothetical protein [Treponema socranskii]|uniref:hypothetical protein n=1 Tax=Treponema socranskii TaxID=53419 RepID=UPI003D6DEEEF
MSDIIRPVITGILISFIFFLMKRSKKKDLDTNTGNTLQLPMYIFIIGLIDFLIFAGFALFSNLFPNGTESAATTILFSAFALLGLFLSYMYFVENYTYDEHAIIYRKINFKKITMEWNSIVNIKYSSGMQWFVIKCADDKKGYFSVMLKGMKPFAELILQKVSTEKTDFKTREMLTVLKNGNTIGSF